MDTGLLKNVTDRLVHSGIATPSQIKGCTSGEIKEIISLANSRLPHMYELFLKAMGRGAGKFFEGTDIFYPEILTIKRGAEELLREDEVPFCLSESDFVFCSHQGYQFMYFKLDELNDDPAVYYYLEGSGIIRKKWDHFSSFLLNAIEDHQKLL